MLSVGSAVGVCARVSAHSVQAASLSSVWFLGRQTIQPLENGFSNDLPKGLRSQTSTHKVPKAKANTFFVGKSVRVTNLAS